MNPTLFIGSSSESLDVAYAAQRNLEDVAEVVVWTQGIFELTKSYLESLLDALEDTEFGLFIFGADDLIKIRGSEMPTARDNVVFELGLFIGRLGRDRTFILMPKSSGDFHLPSDLLGVSTATFQPPSRPERLQAALGPACHDIRLAIRKHSMLRNPASSNAQDLELLLPVLIPEPDQKHLLNIADGKTKGYKGRGSLRSELRHLRSLGID
jgi:predicted nucleotide-binding protein